jgi:hypothetical protein
MRSADLLTMNILALPRGAQKRQNSPPEAVGNYRRQSQQSRMELGCISSTDDEGRQFSVARAANREIVFDQRQLGRLLRAGPLD